MFTKAALLAILLALSVAGVPIGLEAHAVWFHGADAVQARCDRHSHAEWDQSHEAGLEHPVCLVHPPASALRLASANSKVFRAARPVQQSRASRVTKPEFPFLTIHRSRAPPAPI